MILVPLRSREVVLVLALVLGVVAVEEEKAAGSDGSERRSLCRSASMT